MNLQCRRMPSFLAIADFLRPQSLKLGLTFIYGVRISFESFSGVEKIRELARRGEAWGTSESRQMLEHAIEAGRGGV
jgi:hypothetical protein